MRENGREKINYLLQSHVLKHVRVVHQKENRLKCPHCDYLAFAKCHLRNHINMHHTQVKIRTEYRLTVIYKNRRPCAGENDFEMTTVAGFGLPRGFSNGSRELFYPT